MKFLDKLSIKQIVKLGVLIVSIAVISFIIATFYLINILNLDQQTIKQVIKLEEHNKSVVNTIEELNYINYRILLSKNEENLRKLEPLLFEKKSREEKSLINIKGELQKKYNKNIRNINNLVNKQTHIQKQIYQISKQNIFYKKEMKKDISLINEKTDTIIKITNSISGKLSLSNKRLKLEINSQMHRVDDLTIERIKKLFSLKNERVLTLSNQMDKGILRLYNLPKEILFVKNIDELNDIRANKLFQTIRNFDNTLDLLRRKDLKNKKSYEEISLKFLEIKNIISYLLDAKGNMFLLEKELNKLRNQREIINKQLHQKNRNIISIAEKIQFNLIENSEKVMKRSIVIVLLTSIIFAVLIFIVVKTLLSRINTPLENITEFLKNLKINKKGLEQKLQINYNDEFTQLSMAFNVLTKTISKNMYEIQKLNEDLEQRVYERTEELEEANEELQTSIYNLKHTQDKLIESEKMASLGGLVAGVAHEINTPVGIGLTSATHFLDITREIKKSYEEDTMSQDVFEEYLESAKDLATLINSNLNKTAHLVRSFKQIAVDQTSEIKRKINLKEYIHEIIYSLGSITKKLDLEIHVLCDEKLEINTYPGDLNQIITNLVINSIKHGFKDLKKGTIRIEIQTIKNKIQINYKDNGQGISKKNIHKIFEPFFTTNREGGGSGLGLNVIYNILVKKLNGTIVCRSEEGKGVTFTINFPIE